MEPSRDAVALERQDSQSGDRPPDVLYHYTSQQGLMGILGTGELWATKAYYLNDGREISHGFGLARKHLKGRSAFDAENDMGLLLRKLYDYIDRVSLMNVCVASFTEHGDQLSQWRGYGRPGDAYSVGFPKAYLEETWRSQMWQLRKCMYSEGEQLAAIAEVVEGAVERFLFLLEPEHNPDRFGEERLENAADVAGFEFIFALLRVAAAIKDPSFQEECEWRLISGRLDPELISVRQGKHTLIPFHKLQLKKLESQDLSVIVGATQYPELAIGSVSDLMNSRNLRYELISQSKTSFRDW
jgi:hypothetical protein